MSYAPQDIEHSVKQELERRRRSPRTIETYWFCIRKFLDFTNKTIDKISKKDALDFLNYLQERKYAGNSLNVYHMALRFLMEDILRKNIRLNIKYSKRPLNLPLVLTQEETRRLLNSISNQKHKLMISLLYGAGLRVSELINLKVSEINFENKYGFVRQGKGRKDRIFVLAENLISPLKGLIEDEKIGNENYLFPTNRREQYSPRTIAEIIKNACKVAGIEKKVHPHTMRHSFATHLIENGNSINEVQGLLGHKSPETTMIYVHMASPKMMGIKSPLDSLT